MFYTLLTNIGKAKLANATALGTTVQLTHIAVGDGNGSAITPVDTATVLTHEVWRAALNSIAVDPANTNWIVAEGYIPSTSGGFTVREVGLFDIDGDLIAIGSYPDTYKPTLASGSAKDLYIKVIIEVTNSSTVTLKIDPAVVLSTRSYVDSKVVEHEAKADPHSQYLTAAKINSAIAEDPGNTDVFGFYDSFTGLLRKVSLSNLLAVIRTSFDTVYMKLIDNQDIDGVKTFLLSPLTPPPTTTGQVIPMGSILEKTPALIGYDTGSGGSTIQATNKSTAVTLNKPTGLITMNSAALAAGSSVTFAVNNSLIDAFDVPTLRLKDGVSDPRNYRVELAGTSIGGFYIRVTNISAGSLSEPVGIMFVILSGAVL